MSILRTADVVRRTGLSRTTLWRLERKGDFPTRVHLGLNSVGWRVEEIDAWIDRRPRGITKSVVRTGHLSKEQGLRK
jgi:predicted DNA-binding transcriptional regulator AlpA